MKNIGIITKIKIDTLKNGGGSFSIFHNEIADKGYMCSIKDVVIIELEDFNFSILEDIIEKNFSLLTKKNHYLGTWIEDKKVFIDISKNYKNKNYCLKIAKKLNQLAIFDLNTFTSVYIK